MKKFQLKIMERVLLTGTFLLIFVLCSGCQRQKKSEASGTEETTEEQPKVAVRSEGKRPDPVYEADGRIQYPAE